MNLEELIHKRLSEAKNLTKYLTRYAGQPAIFTPEAPGDRESGWGRATQYPRAVFRPMGSARALALFLWP
jgi:hypothetical protein